MHTRTLFVFVALALPSAFACHSAEDASKPTTAAAQIDRGAKVFAKNCARCHGDAGQGSRKAPPLVGKDALPLAPREGQDRKALFHTALDVARFATHEMPPDEEARARMTETDYWAVLAFALSANGVKSSEVVGPNNAGSIVLHP
jgi:cytochrome c